MRNLRIALFTVASLFALTTNAQTVDEVIDKHIEAIGGKEKLNALKSIRMESTMTAQGMEMPLVVTRVQNVGERFDISVMGTENYIITTPTGGWAFIPAMGHSAPQAVPEEEVKAGRDNLDIQGPLFNYKEKGHKLELQGKEKIDSVEAYKIKMTTKDGKERTYYIDTKNHYLVRIQQKAFVMGAEQEQTVNFSDFKKTEDGYLFPYAISGLFGGETVISKIEVNKPVDEKLFKVN